MLKMECERKYRVYKKIADQVGELRIDTAKQEITEGIALSYLGEALLWLDQAKKEGFISKAEEEELRKAGLNDLIKGSATDVTKLTTGQVSTIENRITKMALEKLVECECGDFLAKTPPFGPKTLPIATYKGKKYYVDRRLNELRNVETPWDVVRPIPEQELKGG